MLVGKLKRLCNGWSWVGHDENKSKKSRGERVTQED